MNGNTPKGRLSGTMAIVTGAASGIGGATAEIFGIEGARTVCADINFDGAQATSDRIAAGGGEAIAVRLDIPDPKSAEDCVASAISR